MTIWRQWLSNEGLSKMQMGRATCLNRLVPRREGNGHHEYIDLLFK